MKRFTESGISVLRLSLALLIIFIFGCGGGSGNGKADLQNNSSKAEISAIIGPEGGTVEVTDLNSAIFGTKVIIPKSTLNEKVQISIEESSQDEPLPSDVAANGAVVNLKCSISSSFNNAVVVELTPKEAAGKDEYMDVMYYDENTTQWKSITSWYAYETGKIVFLTDHFSEYISVKRKISSAPGEIRTGFNMKTDTMEYENNQFNYCPEYSGGGRRTQSLRQLKHQAKLYVHWKFGASTP